MSTQDTDTKFFAQPQKQHTTLIAKRLKMNLESVVEGQKNSKV